jgi:hypothetical protein
MASRRTGSLRSFTDSQTTSARAQAAMGSAARATQRAAGATGRAMGSAGKAIGKATTMSAETRAKFRAGGQAMKDNKGKVFFAFIVIAILALGISATLMILHKNYKDGDIEHIKLAHTLLASVAGIIILGITFFLFKSGRLFGILPIFSIAILGQLTAILWDGYTYGFKSRRNVLVDEGGNSVWNTAEKEEAKNLTDSRTSISQWKPFKNDNTGEENFSYTKWYAFTEFVKKYYNDGTSNPYENSTREQFEGLSASDKVTLVEWITQNPDMFPTSLDPDGDGTDNLQPDQLKKLVVLDGTSHTLSISDVLDQDEGAIGQEGYHIPDYVSENEFKYNVDTTPKMFGFRKSVAIQGVALFSTFLLMIVLLGTSAAITKKPVQRIEGYDELSGGEQMDVGGADFNPEYSELA